MINGDGLSLHPLHLGNSDSREILETMLGILQAQDEKEALDLALDKFISIAGAKSGSIFIYDEARRELQPHVWKGECWQRERKPRTFRHKDGIAGHVAFTRKAYYCPDVRRDRIYILSNDEASRDVLSLFSFPIFRADGSVLGVVNIDSTILDAFSAEVRKTLSAVSYAIAVVLERAILFTRYQRRFPEQNLLLQSSSILAMSLQDLDESLKQVCHCAVEVAGGMANANVYLYDRSKRRWEQRFSNRQQFGGHPAITGERYPRPNSGMGAWVLRHHRERLTTLRSEIHPDKLSEGAQAAGCFPLIYRGEIVGLLYVYLREERAFTADEIRVLKEFASIAAAAVKNAHLFQMQTRTAHAFKILNDVSHALQTQTDLQGILDLVVTKALELTGYQRGWIRLRKPKGLHPTLKRILSYRAEQEMAGEWGKELLPAANGLKPRRLCIPLKIGAKQLGLLYLETQSAGISDSTVKQVVSFLAAEAAISLRDTVIGQIDRLATSSFEWAEFQKLLLDVALFFTDAEHGTLRLRDKQSNELILKAHRGGRVVAPRLKIGPVTSIVGRAAHYKTPQLIHDVTVAPWKEMHSPIGSRQMLSVMAVPLLGSGGEVEGILDVESSHSYAFSPEAKQLLEALAHRATTTIQRAYLLTAFNEISAAMAQEDPEVLYRTIIEHTRNLLNAPVCTLWIVTPGKTRQLQLREGIGHPGLSAHELAIAEEKGLFWRAIRTNKPLFSADVQQDTRFRRKQLAQQENWRSAYVVPLAGKEGTPLGILCVYSVKEIRNFSSWERQLAAGLAQHASIALQNFEMLRQLQAAEGQKAFLELLAAVGFSSRQLVHKLNNLLGPLRPKLKGLQQAPHNKALFAEAEQLLDEAFIEVDQWTRHLLDPSLLSLTRVRIASSIERALVQTNLPKSVKLHVSGCERYVCAGELLTIVFAELFENAKRAIKGQGKITVKGAESNGYIQLAVTDTGEGIPAQHLPDLFKFGESPKRTEQQFSGIGLHLTADIVKLLGGTIRVETQVGRGTTFFISVPVSD